MNNKTMVRISRPHLTKLQELATLENRSATNYLETLVEREYKNLKGEMKVRNFEGTVGELSRLLVAKGYNDISFDEGISDILDFGFWTVSKVDGSKNIVINFVTTVKADEELESIMASYIKVNTVKEV
jgi:hypothetical protein